MPDAMLTRNSGSFRDPSGHVYERENRIFRVVAPVVASEYEAARDAGIFRTLVDSGKLVGLEEVDTDSFECGQLEAAYLLEHPRLPFVSYPYEWPFSLLRDAALFHIDLHLKLLDQGFTLSDASAYNVQFVGPKPIFIDHLSIRRYRNGEFWTGHRQFCEQFLNPLLLRSVFGVAHNSWYRGNLEGIPVGDLAKLLRFRHRFSWKFLVHVILQNRFQQQADEKNIEEKFKKKTLPISGYILLLRQLRKWIGGLIPARTSKTTWGDYATDNTYSSDETDAKKRFIAEFVKNTDASTVIDLGCNTGEYSKTALESGATSALGFDFDQDALDKAHRRAKQESLNILPLFLDAMNPSPDQGWHQKERQGYAARANSDAVLALAFEHHLAIARNVGLDQVIEWIVSLAPSGVIEFIPKSDPTVRRMLALRDDIFPDYTEDAFSSILATRRRILKSERVSRSGRTLYAFTNQSA